jgi:C4-dicarboxylate-specific signal transduction histidine kinase
MTREELAEKYERIAFAYVEESSEESLYEMSLLGRELITAEVAPTDLTQLHFDTVDKILEQYPGREYGEVAKLLSALLLEAMMVYAESHQEIIALLRQLRDRYAELDKTKSELEVSRDQLREKTASLIQTEKMTALGELSAGVTHEINQPLNAMMLICQDLIGDVRKARIDTRGLEEGLGDVVTEIRKVADIVDHMRVFARRTAGTRREKVDVNAAVGGVFKILGQQLRLRDIEVTKDLGSGLFVMGDPSRLEQVFMNLIINARDAVTRKEGGAPRRIDVRTYPADRGEHPVARVVAEVTDNGEGVPEALRDRIFEPFFTSKEPGQGTGLGLSLTGEIVDEHGGTLELESPEEGGATFRVILPAAGS